MAVVSFSSDVAQWQARFLANYPIASLTPVGAFNNFGQSILGSITDAKYLAQQAAPGMTLAGSTGNQLVAKLQDYNQVYDTGTPSTVYLTFSVQVAPTNPSGILIPAMTVCTTIGDALNPPVSFQTINDAYIAEGTTTISGVEAICTTTFANNQQSLGNVGPNSVQVIVGSIAGFPTVNNPSYATGGIDGDNDITARAKAFAFLQSKYSAAQLQAKALTVSPVYDAYLYDPQNGSGGVTLYWSDVAGNSNTYGTTPTCWNSGGTGTLQLAEQEVTPPNINVAYSGFTIVAVTLSASYSLPPTMTSAYAAPIIQAAMANFVNQLKHGQAVVPYSMQQFVASALPGLINFTPTVSPSSAATPVNPPTLSSTTTLYRFQGSPSSIVLTLV